MFDQDALVVQIPHLRRFALRLTHNKSDADDLLQSTLLRALEKSEMFTTGSSLFSWASKIMFNIFAGEYRRKKKFETQYDPEPYIASASTHPTQEHSVELAIVTDTMKHLKPEHREVINMVCVMEKPYEEASELLGLPLGTVRSRLFRARGELRDLLEPVAAWQASIYNAITVNGPSQAGK